MKKKNHKNSFLDCNCNADGSLDDTCDAETGKCHCKCNVEGDKCDTCTAGYHTFPDCHGIILFTRNFYL